MKPQSSGKSRVAGIRWQAFALAALVLAAILFGGGGAEGPFNNAVIAAFSALLLGLLFASMVTGSWPVAAFAVPVTVLFGGLVLVIILQLVPLPPDVWQNLPGRELAVQSLRLVGAGDEWRPLSLDPESTRRFAAALLLPAAILYGMLGATRREGLLAVRAVVVGGGISALIGALQLALGSPAWLTFYGGGNAGAASGVFANANHHATMLIIAMLCLAFLIRAERPRQPTKAGAFPPGFHPAWLLMPFFFALVVATGSRAGLVLVAFATAAVMLVAFRQRSPMLMLGGVAAAAILFFGLVLLSPSGNLVAVGQSFLFSDDSRRQFLPDVLYTLGQYWPWGSGFGTFVSAFAPNENLDIAGAGYVNHAHNDSVEWVLEAGILGALWLAAAAAVLAWRAGSVVLKSGGMRGSAVAAVLAGGFALLLVGLHSSVDYPLRSFAVSAAAAVAAGLLLAPLGDAPPRPPKRGAAKWPLAVGAALGAAVAAVSLWLFIGESAFRSGNGLAAADLRPQNSWGLALAAEQELADKNSGAARALATQAVRQAPMTSPAVRVLAVTAGNPAAATAAWQVASAMGWRDAPTQLWAFRQALLSGQLDIAAVRADAFMRTRSQRPEEYMAVVRTAAIDPRFRLELMKRLLLGPPWREALFDVSGSISNQALQGLSQLLTSMAHSGLKPTLGEARPVISALLERGQFDTAHTIYRAVRGPSPTTANLLDDGDFRRTPDDYRANSTPFDWLMFRTQGASASIEEQNGGYLVVESDGTAARALVRRYVPLGPGGYQLRYVRRGDPDSPDSVRLVIRCAKGMVLATSSADPLQGSGFESRETRFEVPPNCSMIIIEIRAMALGHSTSAEFDQFSLRRLPGRAAP